MFRHACLLISIVICFWAPWVQAHKIKLFATAQGHLIHGYAYAPGGGRIPQATVEVWGPAGQRLGETTTDAEGEFNYSAKQRLDHRFILETADGHKAEYTLKAYELSSELSETQSQRNSSPLTPVPETKCPELTPLIERVLSQHLRPLREQLAHYQEKIWLHDILGGIGYIFGIMGLLYYLNQTFKK